MLETGGARISLGDVELEIFARGPQAAETILFLHDLDYVNGVDAPFIATLAQTRRVVAPSHPGFGGSPLPDGCDAIDDFTYIYLDLLRDLGSVHLVGAGLGGWIAAELAVRCTHAIRSLVLVDALGIKVGDRFASDIKDMFVVSPDELVQLCWHDVAIGQREMPLPSADFDEETLTRLLTGRQTAALLGWNPFMHNPKLRARLRRIDRPTLVIWGASDGLVTPEYGLAYSESIPDARFKLIGGAGHYPYLEEPVQFVETLTSFLDQLQ